MALSIKSWVQSGSPNVLNITATIPTSPAPASGDVVLVLVGSNPGVPDTIVGPAGWLEQHTASYQNGAQIGKLFSRPWVSGLANPAFTWTTRCQGGYKTIVVSGATGLVPSTVSSRIVPNTGTPPAPTIQGNNVIAVANIDATNAIEITCSFPPPTGISETTERVHGTAG